jgi:hypothetical protein
MLSHSSTPNNSRRPVYIGIQNPQEFYTNDDVVKGAVCVHPTERPRAIRVTFKGRCKMKISPSNEKVTYKSTLELFSYEQVLFNSSNLEESYDIVRRGIGDNGKVQLPFEFRFPEKVQMPPTNGHKPRPGFEHEPGHPLPTSFEYSVGQNVYSTEYYLEALVYKSVVWSPDETIIQKLPFRPTPPVTDPNQFVQRPKFAEFYIRSHSLNWDSAQEPSTLTKIRWSLTKAQDSTPVARWRVVAHCPYRLITGGIIPVSFSFHQLDSSPNLSQEPVVRIGQIRVKLTCKLSTRIPHRGFTGERDITDFDETDIFEKRFLGYNKVMRHGLKLAELGDFRLPPTILPSFQTYGLRLMYRIKIVVEGECATQEFSVTALRDTCEVVCGVQRPGTTGPIGTDVAGTSGVLAQDGPGDEPLPAYEPAPSYEEAIP